MLRANVNMPKQWGGKLKPRMPFILSPMFPPEYLALVAEIQDQLERCATISERVDRTGINDPQFHIENDKLTELFHRLTAFRKRLRVTD